ncbi:MAG: (d)CMP kinase [Atopococcus tabaci]|uniref:Cytidylate kinase n=1 Tax=Atopococcus tabaci TaxID=269774 RepID=A0AA43UBK8_9LACT|nr:(d)CMP kinase [Atopococcus tabaci]
MKKIVTVAIDGPASSGKSTVSRCLARDLNYIHIDTGAMYRGLTLAAIENQVPFDDEKELFDLLSKLNVSFEHHEGRQHVYINQRDVTKDIRTREVTNHASEVAAHSSIRKELVNRQRLLAENNNVIMDGRDIGTVVLPQADFKFFLDANVEERAHRRHKENLERGIESSFEEIKKELEERDFKDKNREVAPLKAAEDAIIIDTTEMDIHQVILKIKEYLSEES